MFHTTGNEDTPTVGRWAQHAVRSAGQAVNQVARRAERRAARAVDGLLIRGTRQGPFAIEIERDLQVPMDDDAVLLADLLRPVTRAPHLPTVVVRSPYGRRGPYATEARFLASHGFTVLCQSCRGTAGSQGEFTPQADEQRDGIATHRWVRRQPWFTGHAVTFGGSYLGYTQWAVTPYMLRDDPGNAPEANILLVTTADIGETIWSTGGFALRSSLGWTTQRVKADTNEVTALMSYVLPSKRLERAFDVLPLSAGDAAASGHTLGWYQDWLRHEDLTDEYWTRQSHTAAVPDVTVPVFMSTGWWDIFLPWQLANYQALVEAGNQPRLVIGPHGHSTPGRVLEEVVAFLKEHFPSGDSRDTGPTPVAQPGVPGASRRGAQPEPWTEPESWTEPVRAYLTGAERWYRLPAWPPPGTTSHTWYLHPGTSDGPEPPHPPTAVGPGHHLSARHAPAPNPPGGLSRAPGASGTTSYTYDPADPTPTVGGGALGIKPGSRDCADHERRPDVVTFRSEPLTRPLDVAGSPTARIRFRSSAPSFDVYVRLTDVHPDGRSMSICDWIRRIGAPGTSGTDPAPDADGFREVEVVLWPAFHRIAAGHRIGVQISSGAHPRLARNPGTGGPVADEVRLVVAHQEIAHGGVTGARIDIPVWERGVSSTTTHR